MNRQNILIGIVIVGAAVLGAGYWYRNHKSAVAPNPVERTQTDKGVAKKTASKTTAANAGKRGAQKKNIAEKRAAEPMPDLPNDLQAEADRMQDALDDDNPTGIVKSARVLLASGNSEARREAAEALGSAGWDGFADLTTLLLDPDKEVAEAARDSLQLEITDMDDEEMKKKMYKSVAELVVSKDSEYFESVVSDASVEMSDNEMVTLLISLYPQTEENTESQKIIIEKIDDVVVPDIKSRSFEDAQKAVDAWRTQNAEDIAEEQKSAAETAGGAEQ